VSQHGWQWGLILLLAGSPVFAQSGAVDPGVQAKADAGDIQAQVIVGERILAGTGAPRDSRELAADYSQAAGWFRKAAEKGNVEAEVHLADLYRDGRGVTRDMTQAITWYRKAAETGDAGAQGTLGILYSVGMGVSRDDVEAYYWLSLAADAKSPNQAKRIANRQSAGEHITTDQQAAVQDRVAGWKAAHPRTRP
jgi:TPR repeat protein